MTFCPIISAHTVLTGSASSNSSQGKICSDEISQQISIPKISLPSINNTTFTRTIIRGRHSEIQSKLNMKSTFK